MWYEKDLLSLIYLQVTQKSSQEKFKQVRLRNEVSWGKTLQTLHVARILEEAQWPRQTLLKNSHHGYSLLVPSFSGGEEGGVIP